MTKIFCALLKTTIPIILDLFHFQIGFTAQAELALQSHTCPFWLPSFYWLDINADPFEDSSLQILWLLEVPYWNARQSKTSAEED